MRAHRIEHHAAPHIAANCLSQGVSNAAANRVVGEDIDQQIDLAARTCDVVRDGLVVFTDDNHLTATFSRSVAEVLGDRIAAAMR